MATARMECPECRGPMENKGNVNGMVLTSNPPQWDETWICPVCKIKKVVRVSAPLVTHDYLEDYRSVQ